MRESAYTGPKILNMKLPGRRKRVRSQRRLHAEGWCDRGAF